MADYGSVGNFRSFFGFGVTLGPFVSGGQFRVLGSNLGQCLVWWTLLTDFGLEGYLRAILCRGAILCHFGSFLGLVVT